jgi:SM-20-related protein
MEASFESLINSYIESKVGIASNFLPESLSVQLQQEILYLYSHNKMRAAGTGISGKVQHDTNNRGDAIYWLDRKHNNKPENAFLDHIESFIEYLNANCYTGITNYEFHYTLYQPGTFYKKHIDQFQGNNNRIFSIISYLNANWKEVDGGELSIHHKNQTQLITPTNRKTVFFKSNELEHEVLITHAPRLSITGWLKK